MRTFLSIGVKCHTMDCPLGSRKPGRDTRSSTVAGVRRSAGGSTLVELLIVISIIGILVALLMPAVNSAREAGRRAQCLNNCKQMALGCLGHEAKYGFFPTGGWGSMWAGDPDRGYNKRQPGGWHYNILPFIDQTDLHDLGTGGHRGHAFVVGDDAGSHSAQTPVSLFICPTRHKVQVYPYTHSVPFNLTALQHLRWPQRLRCQRRRRRGRRQPERRPIGTDPGLPHGRFRPESLWASFPGGAEWATGPIFVRSECTTAAIKDGTTFTYLLGERFINPDSYYTGSQCDNDQEWDLGFDYDTNRWTYYPPSQDRPGITGCNKIFGSATRRASTWPSATARSAAFPTISIRRPISNWAIAWMASRRNCRTSIRRRIRSVTNLPTTTDAADAATSLTLRLSPPTASDREDTGEYGLRRLSAGPRRSSFPGPEEAARSVRQGR